jgi:hypothetical protein
MHWSQLCAILWLRWRLTRNQWSRGGRVNAVITMVIAVLAVLIGVSGGLGGLLVGGFYLAGMSPLHLLVLWDILVGAFTLFWLIGVLSEIQRSEAIDLGKILHLPVSLRGVFLVNYLASHVTLSIIVFVPWMAGLALGLALSHGGAMLWLLPLALGYLHLITAWTYYLRGWLVALMKNNPRRYHAVVASISILFILLSQLPNLLMNGHHGHGRGVPNRTSRVETAAPAENDVPPAISPTALLLHKAIPPLWVGNGAMSLAMGHPWPAVLGAAGAFALGGLGLGCAYRSTRRFYEGRGGATRAKRKRKQARAAGAAGVFLERSLPGLPEEVAAVALGTLRSLTRATEVRMALASTIPMLLIYGGMMLFSASPLPAGNILLFYASGIALLPFLGLMQLLANPFGFDRSGFRTLVLSPAPRRQILLGKNLALLPIALGLGLIYMALAGLVRHIPPVILLAALVQLLAAFLLLSMYGNLLAVVAPHRVAAGSLKPTKVSAGRNLLLMLSFFLFPVVSLPILFPALLAMALSSRDGPLAALLTLLFSTIELVVFAASYWLTLPRFGDILQRREKQILQVVTQEVE